MQQFYEIRPPQRPEKLLRDIDVLRGKIDNRKPLEPDLWSVIQKKLRIDWTYDTNALEGSTLTYGETLFLLNEGLTVEGKPFKDFLDAKNHAEAISEHPLICGAVAHYNMVRIHPFDDGNGRGARLLMNLLLIQKWYPPAIIRMSKRREYLHALGTADQGELAPFVTFMAESLLETEKLIWVDIEDRLG